MQITAFSGFSKRINSTKRPTGGTSIDVALKTPCSVMTPTFRISGFNLAWDYIEWGSRYYYVDDITIETNDIALYHCKLDSLATFKSDILASTQYVTRSASAFDPLVIDKAYPTLADAHVDSNNFSMSASTGVGTYVVGVINDLAHGGVSYYTFGAGGSGFSSFLQYMFSDAWLSDDPDISVEIQKELINPFQYVVSCNWFPFSIAGNLASVKFGYWTSGISAGLLSESQRLFTTTGTVSLPRHPQATTHGTYMNGAPYTRHTIDVYSFGQIPLDPAPFVSSAGLTIDVIVDLFAASAELRITNSTGTFEKRYHSDFGVPIQLSQVNQKMVQSAMGVVAGAGAGAAAGAALTPVGAIVGGVLGAVAGVGSGVNNLFPQVQTAGSMGSKNAFIRTPFVQSEFYYCPSTAPAIVGRPLMAARTLSSLSGYTVCENVDLNTNASPDEKSEIIQYMSNGFFIE